DPAEQPDPGAAFELRTQRAVAGEREHSLTDAGERVCETDDVLPLSEGANTEKRGCAVRRRPEREALEVDAGVDDVGLPARLRDLRLQLDAEVLGDGDDGRGAANDEPRRRGHTRKGADV